MISFYRIPFIIKLYWLQHLSMHLFTCVQHWSCQKMLSILLKIYQNQTVRLATSDSDSELLHESSLYRRGWLATHKGRLWFAICHAKLPSCQFNKPCPWDSSGRGKPLLYLIRHLPPPLLPRSPCCQLSQLTIKNVSGKPRGLHWHAPSECVDCIRVVCVCGS